LEYIKNGDKMSLPKEALHQVITWFKKNIVIPAYRDQFPYDQKKNVGEKRSFWILFPAIVRVLMPKKILEWGPGNSTEAFLNGNNAVEVFSYENKKEWHDHYLKEFETKRPDLKGRYHFYLEPDRDKYIKTEFVEKTFDIAFVDGDVGTFPLRTRIDCFLRATELVKDDGMIIIHDIDRFPYSPDWVNPSWVVMGHYNYYPEMIQQTAIFINMDRLKNRNELINVFHEFKRTFPK